jgi:predicted nucleotidyltransferase
VSERAFNPNLIVPAGTEIVARIPVRSIGATHALPKGAVGVVVQSPLDGSHAYRVRFVDGSEAMLRRAELAVLKHVQRWGLERVGGVLEDYNLYEFVIFRCVVGSRAYGLDEPGSDTDRRGIYLPPADLHWSLYGVPEQLESDGTEEAYWELQKFLTLALKANPNILECLYSPLVEHASPIAEELLAMRSGFLSRLVYQTYNGYVLSQFRRIEQHRRNHEGEIKWKHPMHLIRLLIAGIRTLREGAVPVHVGEYRERLLSIRRGEMSWDEVNDWRLELHREFDAAFETTKLPERPDYDAANAFLVRARRSMVQME